ncbi:HAMP domain protein [Burkholderia pseudomallei]|nr:HAMP domain protein [Burkholderia pseudomallei]
MLRSLQGRLSAALVAGLVALSAAGGAAAFYVLRAEVEQMSDSALQETAQRLLPLAVMDIVGRDSDGDDGDGGGGRIAAVRPHDELLTYIVRDETGKLLLRSHDANARLFPKNLKAGFARTATHRVYAETVLQGTVTLLIAEPLATRRRAEVQAAFAVVRPLALFLPVGLLGIWLIVRSGLTPIRRFCGAIAARGRNDLTPLDKGGLPAEIAPVADAVTELMARLDRALAAERSFAANSAHELRTPIAAALAQTQRLIAEASAEPLRERARRVEGALHTLSRVSEQLMQLAKAEDGRVLADTPQDLRPVLALVVDDFRRGARDRAIALELPDTAVTSRIDPDAFAIVVRNLVENALKHGAAAEPVRVALSAAGALSVTNRGPVLAAAELERLTKPFERGATAAKGSGLGLAIVDAIAKGAGASFTLRSPAPGVTDGVQARVDGLACGGGPAAKGGAGMGERARRGAARSRAPPPKRIPQRRAARRGQIRARHPRPFPVAIPIAIPVASPAARPAGAPLTGCCRVRRVPGRDTRSAGICRRGDPDLGRRRHAAIRRDRPSARGRSGKRRRGGSRSAG